MHKTGEYRTEFRIHFVTPYCSFFFTLVSRCHIYAPSCFLYIMQQAVSFSPYRTLIWQMRLDHDQKQWLQRGVCSYRVHYCIPLIWPYFQVPPHLSFHAPSQYYRKLCLYIYLLAFSLLPKQWKAWELQYAFWTSRILTLSI